MSEKKLKRTVCLAILPFDNLTGNVEQDYFSRGFVEDLIIDLSRFSNIQVLSSQTSLELNTDIANDKDKTKELGIDYYLSGSLRRVGSKLRINCQLTNPVDKTVLWAERFDSPQETIFDIYDNITEKVVGSLSVKIDSSLLVDARRKPITDLKAYDCWLRGFEYLRQGTLADDERARIIFEHALEIDPHYGRAYAGLSLSYFNEWSCQLWERWDETEKLAYENAIKAVEYDENDHVTQMVLGRILLYRREFDQAEKHIDRAQLLNPNDADNLIQIAGVKGLLGKSKEGIQLFEKALQLNPFHQNWYYIYGSIACLTDRQYEKVLELTQKVSPTISVDTPANIAIAHAYLGNKKEAEYNVQLFKNTFVEKITFGKEPEAGEELRWYKYVNPFKNKDDLNVLVEGLNLAGYNYETTYTLVTESAPKKGNKQNMFKSDGKVWHMSFDNTEVQLAELKGFLDIAKMLERPGLQLHCNELLGIENYDKGMDIFDSKAQNDIKERIKDLQEDLEEAESFNDLVRSEKIKTERDKLIDHLTKASGLAGRSRKLGSQTEKARTSVTWRIRSAIKKIEEVHPQLSKHLNNSIQTGTFCSYNPEKEMLWQL